MKRRQGGAKALVALIHVGGSTMRRITASPARKQPPRSNGGGGERSRTGLDVHLREALLQRHPRGKARRCTEDDRGHEHAGGHADAGTERKHGEVNGRVEEQPGLREPCGVECDLAGGLGGVADREEAADELVRGGPEPRREVVVLAVRAPPPHALHAWHSSCFAACRDPRCVGEAVATAAGTSRRAALKHRTRSKWPLPLVCVSADAMGCAWGRGTAGSAGGESAGGASRTRK